jgi:hypothetical protein
MNERPLEGPTNRAAGSHGEESCGVQETNSRSGQNTEEVGSPQCEAANLTTMFIRTFDESTYRLAKELSEAGIPVRPIPDKDIPESQLPAIHVRTRRIIGEEAIRAYKNEQQASREN